MDSKDDYYGLYMPIVGTSPTILYLVEGNVLCVKESCFGGQMDCESADQWIEQRKIDFPEQTWEKRFEQNLLTNSFASNNVNHINYSDLAPNQCWVVRKY